MKFCGVRAGTSTIDARRAGYTTTSSEIKVSITGAQGSRGFATKATNRYRPLN